MNPLMAVGQLWNLTDEANPRFLGTCFSFRWVRYMITASHCLGGLEVNQVGVSLSDSPGRVLEVRDLARHETADIAVLTLPELDPEPYEPFWAVAGNWGLGEEFFAHGWPEDVVSEPYPEPRVFVGHYQRFIYGHESHLGYRYVAGELSIPCHGGLSGGPLFRRGARQILTGMVTENRDTYTVLDSVSEIMKDGVRYREESRRVISYGLALMLSHVSEWLDEQVPPRSSGEIVEAFRQGGSHG